LIGSINKLDTSLEASLLDISHTSTTTKNLRLDDTSVREFTSDFEGFIRGCGNFTERDGNLVGFEQGTSLIFVQFDSSEMGVHKVGLELFGRSES
jgi:hypothetical protein